MVELLRISASLFGVGAVISNATYRYLTNWDRFHSRHILFPVEPKEALFHIGVGETIQAAKDIVHLRITAVGGPSIATCDGEFDFMLVDTRLDWLLKDDLPRMAAYAVTNSPPLRDQRSYWAWMELWDVDPDTGNVKFLTNKVDLRDLL